MLNATRRVDFIEVAVCTDPVFYVVGLARLDRERAFGNLSVEIVRRDAALKTLCILENRYL